MHTHVNRKAIIKLIHVNKNPENSVSFRINDNIKIYIFIVLISYMVSIEKFETALIN